VLLPDAPPLLSLDFGPTTWRFWRFEGHFWGRSDEHPPGFAACFLDHDGGLWRSWKGDDVRAARERLRATIRNEGFFRAISFGQERVLLHRSQSFAQNASGDLARFEMKGARWSQTRFLLETDVGELEKALAKERKRAHSDLAMAFSWLSAPPDERIYWGLQWTTGDGRALRRLIFCAFWNCAEIWTARSQLEYRLSAAPGADFSLETAFVDFEGLPRPHFKAAPPPMARLLSKIVARNRPYLPKGVRLNRELGTGPLAQRETSRIGTIAFRIASPNAHEGLEARLELRDWLRDEAPELLEDWFT